MLSVVRSRAKVFKNEAGRRFLRWRERERELDWSVPLLDVQRAAVAAIGAAADGSVLSTTTSDDASRTIQCRDAARDDAVDIFGSRRAAFQRRTRESEFW